MSSPKIPQDRPKTTPRLSQSYVFRCSHFGHRIASKMAQDRPQTAPRPSKASQDRPKIAFKIAEDRPPPDRPTTAQDPLRLAQDHPEVPPELAGARHLEPELARRSPGARRSSPSRAGARPELAQAPWSSASRARARPKLAWNIPKSGCKGLQVNKSIELILGKLSARGKFCGL